MKAPRTVRKWVIVLVVVICGVCVAYVFRSETKSLPASGEMLWSMTIHGSSELVKSLLDRGVNPNFSGNRGKSPLHEAARCGRIEIAKLLIEAGADVNAVDERGMTPLMECALWLNSTGSHLEIARLLLTNGADPETKAFDVGEKSITGFLGEFTVKDILDRQGDEPVVQEFRQLIGMPRHPPPKKNPLVG